MQEYQGVFERIEKKYMLTRPQHEALSAALAERMTEDQYGLHTINNLYFDTEDYALIRASIEKPVYKEKLRLRAYGQAKPDSMVFVELKKKYKGIVYKRRAPLLLAEANAYLLHGIRPRRHSQVLREVDAFMDFYGRPAPKAFIAYDRLALLSQSDPGLRVTFDRNIRFRSHQLDLGLESQGTPILAAGHVLMEVKIPGAMPVWLSRILSSLSVFPTSYSKYGTCYQRFIAANAGKGELAHVS